MREIEGDYNPPNHAQEDSLFIVVEVHKLHKYGQVCQVKNSLFALLVVLDERKGSAPATVYPLLNNTGNVFVVINTASEKMQTSCFNEKR